MELYSKLHKYYINLASRPDRNARFINMVGSDFSRVNAFCGKDHDLLYLRKIFDLKRSFKRYNYELNLGQISCTISHFRLYQYILRDQDIHDDDWVLICEDDITFAPDFKNRLNQLLQQLKQRRFEKLNFLFLNYYHHKDFIDLTPELKSLINGRKIVFNSAKRYKAIEILMLNNGVRVESEKQFFSFPYQNLAQTHDTELVPEEVQHLVLPNHANIYSSACYLVRKRALQCIKNIDRPYWLADDFFAFIARPYMMFCVPDLALAPSEESDISTPGDESFDNIIHVSEHSSMYHRVTKYAFSNLADLYSTDPLKRWAVEQQLKLMHLDLSSYEFSLLEDKDLGYLQLRKLDDYLKYKTKDLPF